MPETLRPNAVDTICDHNGEFWDAHRFQFCIENKKINLVKQALHEFYKYDKLLNWLRDEVESSLKKKSSDTIIITDSTELALYIASLGPNNSDLMIQQACQYGLYNVLEHLLRYHMDKYLIDEHGKSRSWPKFAEYFKILANEPFKEFDGGCDIFEDDRIKMIESNKMDYKKCFQLLVDYAFATKIPFDVNEQHVATFASLLHWAVEYNCHDAILKLSKAGAYLGLLDQRNEPAISDIDPELLECIFDSCISSKRMNMLFNFQNLICHSKLECQSDVISIINVASETKSFNKRYSNMYMYNVSSREELNVNIESSVEKQRSQLIAPLISMQMNHFQKKFPNDMGIIAYMSNRSEIRHLLEHPLIEALLFIKWSQSLRVFRKLSFCYAFITMLSIVCFCLDCDTPSRRVWLAVIQFVFVIISVLIYVFWNLQIRLRKMNKILKDYRPSIRNSLQYLIGIVAIAGSLALFCFFPSEFKAIYVLIAVFHFGLSILRTSTYSVMFKAVALNTIRSLQIYVVLFVAFGLSFYLLFRDQQTADRNSNSMNMEEQCVNFFKNKTNSNEKSQRELNQSFESMQKMCENIDRNLDLNQFLSFDTTVLMRIIAASHRPKHIDLSHPKYITAIVFIVFIFCVSIIFVNLMNALAVGDIQKISADAELSVLVEKCHLLAQYYELTSSIPWFT